MTIFAVIKSLLFKKPTLVFNITNFYRKDKKMNKEITGLGELDCKTLAKIVEHDVAKNGKLEYAESAYDELERRSVEINRLG